jgi:hypothetical protein
MAAFVNRMRLFVPRKFWQRILKIPILIHLITMLPITRGKKIHNFQFQIFQFIPFLQPKKYTSVVLYIMHFSNINYTVKLEYIYIR